ncbi:small cell adhesion glycoprotein [Discoglossus pictus]
MAILPTADSGVELTPPFIKATSSSSSNTDGLDIGIIAGVISAVFVTLLVVLVLITIYLYKHKGTYRTCEDPEEARKSLQMENSTSSQEKQEYLM